MRTHEAKRAAIEDELTTMSASEQDNMTYEKPKQKAKWAAVQRASTMLKFSRT